MIRRSCWKRGTNHIAIRQARADVTKVATILSTVLIDVSPVAVLPLFVPRPSIPLADSLPRPPPFLAPPYPIAT